MPRTKSLLARRISVLFASGLALAMSRCFQMLATSVLVTGKFRSDLLSSVMIVSFAVVQGGALWDAATQMLGKF